MEVQQVVVLTENGDLQLTSLSRHVLYHSIASLLPRHATHALLPKSGSRKVDNFVADLPQSILLKGPRKKHSLTESMLGTTQLVPSIEIHRFLDRAISVADFTLILEKKLLSLSAGEIDPDRLHEICWEYYEVERKQEISIPQWFSTTCTYRLWLVFCCVSEQALSDKLSAKTANEVIKRLVELCGYTWNETYRYSDTEFLEFPQYLHAIAGYFTRLRLEMSLTCEVILDMLDEIVHGVLKKGYLTKKGHKRKNMKKRWFVLQRNIMKYFDSREAMSLKGQLILNSNTEVKGIPDKGKKRCWFEVTCGHTGKQFEIFADDQRSKHEWMLAIKKAIALAKVMDGSLKQDDYTEYLTGFYLLKYGTPQPSLSRQDSTVRGMKYHATLKAQRKRLSGKERGSKGISVSKPRSDSTGEENDPFSPSDEYMEMSAGRDISSASSDDSDGYTEMTPVSEELKQRSRSLEMLDKVKGEVESEDLSKSCVVSALAKPKTLKPTNQDADTLQEEEEEDIMSSSVYEDADFTQIYKPPKNDPQLGGYIEVAIKEQTGGSKKSPSKDSKDGNEEVGLVTARSMDLGELDEKLRSPSPHEYLTIVRGDSDPPRSSQENPPPVPTRKSPTPDRILDSPQMEPTAMSHSFTDRYTPPLKPKPKKSLERGLSVPMNPTHKDHAPPLPSRGYRFSEPSIESSAASRTASASSTMKYKSPPLPPVPDDSSSLSSNYAPPLPPR